jgi:hypothetical protein
MITSKLWKMALTCTSLRHQTRGSVAFVKALLQTNWSVKCEIDLEVGVAPGIPIKVKGTVVTSASLQVVSEEKWELQVENTKVKGSNIPIFNQIMEMTKNVMAPFSPTRPFLVCDWITN